MEKSSIKPSAFWRLEEILNETSIWCTTLRRKTALLQEWPGACKNKPSTFFASEYSIVKTSLMVLMMMDRVERNAHALYWVFFDNNRGKKAHILPLRQNKQMRFQVYRWAVLLNKCLPFMYNYFLTETALQTRHKISSTGTSRPFVCMCSNERGFWKIKTLHQQHTNALKENE